MPRFTSQGLLPITFKLNPLLNIKMMNQFESLMPRTHTTNLNIHMRDPPHTTSTPPTLQEHRLHTRAAGQQRLSSFGDDTEPQGGRIEIRVRAPLSPAT